MGLIWLVVSIAQPLTALVFGFVLGLHSISLAVWQGWRKFRFRDADWGLVKKSIRLIGYASVIPAPFIIYNAILFSKDTFLSRWTAQNLIISPHPMHYLVAYGFMIPFALIGGRRILRLRSWQGWLVASWVMAIPVLAYAPVNLQRRLPEGVWVALVILGMKAFDRGGGELPRSYKGRILLLLLACLPSSLILLSGGFFAASRPGLPLFRPVGEINAFEFIADEAKAGEVVLTSYQTGNALPAWAPLRVLIGHGPESVGLSELRPKVERFYGDQISDLERLSLIRDYDIGYVFRGPYEAALGDWNPAQADYLQPIYQSGGYEVYRVVQK